MYKKHAPLLSHLIRSLCNVEVGEHAGNRAFLRQSHTPAADEHEGLNPNVPMEEGWNEEDDWNDQEEWHSSVDGSSTLDSNYRNNGRCQNGEPKAPATHAQTLPATTILQRKR